MSDRTNSRRRFLAVAGASLTTALAGCNGDEPTTPGASDGSGSGSGNGGSGPTPTATPTPTVTPSPTELRDRALARLTETITESIIWHGAEYDRVRTQIRIRANRVLGVAEELRNSSSVTTTDLDRLEETTSAMATYLRDNLAPYYPIPKENIALAGDNSLVQQVRLAAERGDPQGLDDALGRLISFYSNYKDRDFYETNFPNGPIYERLVDRLRNKQTRLPLFEVVHPSSGFFAPCHLDLEPEDFNIDLVPQHTHEFPTGHKFAVHSHPHESIHELSDHQNEPVDRRIYAWSGSSYDILVDDDADFADVSQYRVGRADIFEPMSLPERRTGEAYVAVSLRSEQDNKNANRNFDSVPIQLQQFESADAAEQALSDLLAADVFAQGTATLLDFEEEDPQPEPLRWQRVFYTKQGTNLYAFARQIGSVIVTIGPSTDEWQNRADWPGPLTETWLANRELGQEN